MTAPLGGRTEGGGGGGRRVYNTVDAHPTHAAGGEDGSAWNKPPFLPGRGRRRRAFGRRRTIAGQALLFFRATASSDRPKAGSQLRSSARKRMSTSKKRNCRLGITLYRRIRPLMNQPIAPRKLKCRRRSTSNPFSAS